MVSPSLDEVDPKPVLTDIDSSSSQLHRPVPISASQTRASNFFNFPIIFPRTIVAASFTLTLPEAIYTGVRRYTRQIQADLPHRSCSNCWIAILSPFQGLGRGTDVWGRGGGVHPGGGVALGGSRGVFISRERGEKGFCFPSPNNLYQRTYIIRSYDQDCNGFPTILFEFIAREAYLQNGLKLTLASHGLIILTSRGGYQCGYSLFDIILAHVYLSPGVLRLCQ